MPTIDLGGLASSELILCARKIVRVKNGALKHSLAHFVGESECRRPCRRALDLEVIDADFDSVLLDTNLVAVLAQEETP